MVQHLARQLPGHQIVVLTRRPDEVRDHHAAAVYADLKKPGLAMDADIRAELQDRASLVVHCAADTRFNLSLEEARAANTEGTRHALELAEGCPKLEQFAQISTLYVAGKRAGAVTEAPLRHDEGYFNSYEEAKHEAEALVLERADKMPVAIYRLSSVVDVGGNSGHLRQVVRFLPRSNQIPFFPAHRDVPVNLVTAEWTARALAALICRHFEARAVRHVCAGPEDTLPFGTIMDMAFSVYESATDIVLRRPTLVSLSDFGRLSGRLPRGSRIATVVDRLMTFIPHLSISQPFECDATAELLAASGVPRPDPRALLREVLEAEFRGAQVQA